MKSKVWSLFKFSFAMACGIYAFEFYRKNAGSASLLSKAFQFGFLLVAVVFLCGFFLWLGGSLYLKLKNLPQEPLISYFKRDEVFFSMTKTRRFFFGAMALIGISFIFSHGLAPRHIIAVISYISLLSFLYGEI